MPKLRGIAASSSFTTLHGTYFVFYAGEQSFILHHTNRYLTWE